MVQHTKSSIFLKKKVVFSSLYYVFIAETTCNSTSYAAEQIHNSEI